MVITYKTDGATKALIRSFSQRLQSAHRSHGGHDPTGRREALEVLIFLRDVKSELYFEQMKGAARRTIS